MTSSMLLGQPEVSTAGIKEVGPVKSCPWREHSMVRNLGCLGLCARRGCFASDGWTERGFLREYVDT